jgi:inhibitor of cysteine peptidase
VQQVSEEDNGKEFPLRVGGALELILPENPTAGFRWSFQSKAERVLKVASDRFIPGRRLGETGYHHWVIEGAAAGRGELGLIYRRPWASDERPAKTFAIIIPVAGK